MQATSLLPRLVAPEKTARAPQVISRRQAAAETAFGCPRDFLGNRFVYTVISARARGLSIGVNMNPNKECNFNCGYCEVNRTLAAREAVLDVEVMARELERTLELVRSGGIRGRPAYQELPDELLELRHVALSGDGEPTLCPCFVEAVQAVMHVRARGGFPFFKVVLITNSTGLEKPRVREGLSCFGPRDEIWAKLDAGTQAHMDRVNSPHCRLETVLANILLVGRQRPITIQSLFPLVNGEEPSGEDLGEYASRLRELKAGGARIAQVQIYSATRPMQRSQCGHLPLKTLSKIAQRVRDEVGLPAEVF